MSASNAGDAPVRANAKPSSSDLSPLGQAALALARAGFPVLPNHNIAGGACTCGGKPGCKPGKHPRVQGGAHAGTTDEAVIRDWWTTWPNANIGIASGRALPDGGFLYLVDVDERNGGRASLARLVATIGKLPATRIHQSGSECPHILLRTDEPMPSTKLKDFPGLDFIGVGLQFVAPPSMHESGHKYDALEDGECFYEGEPYELEASATIARMPDGLRDLITLHAGTSRNEKSCFAPTPIDESHPDWKRRVSMAIEACKTMPAQADGTGGTPLFNVCLKLVRALELPLEVAHELLVEHFNPRATDANGSPWPWTDDELAHKLLDARDRSDVPCGIAPPEFHAMVASHTNPNRTPKAPPKTDERDKVAAGDSYDGERQKITRAGLVQMLYSWPDWDGVFWFDVLAQKIRATNPPVEGNMTLERGELSKGDLALVAHWLDVKGFLASKEMIEDAIWTVVRAPDRQVNPIARYLDSLSPVTEAMVLPTLATDILKCTDKSANTKLMKTLVAAVRRARNPGAFHKAMLVIKGEQRCGKTPFVKILAGEWYQTTGNGNLADRDTILECQGKWLVEVEELSALGKADANALKTAISRSHDPITKKYEPDARNYLRSFVLIGTTNKDEFLTDSTGNARYWVVEVPDGEKIDLARLAQVRDVIWAEADFLAGSGESNELDEQEHAELEKENAAYLETHPWLDEVSRFLAGKTEVANATQVLMYVLKGDSTRVTQKAKNDVADIMRTLGCKAKQRRVNGKVVKYWSVPEDMAAREHSKVLPLRAVTLSP